MHWISAERSATRGGGYPSTVAHPLPRVGTPSPARPSGSHVEFHHTLDMDDTYVGDATHELSSQQLSAASRASGHTPSPSTTISAYPSALPSRLSWPLHAHPLVYAGTSSGSSVHICSCRNCRSEHYNTAVYSCLEQGCNYHICIQCALQHYTAIREQERQQQMKRRGGAAGGKAAASSLEGKYEDDAEDAVDVDMTQRMPIRGGAAGAYARISAQSRQWMQAVHASASSTAIPLVLSIHHHPHPLLYTPITPLQLHADTENKLHTHTPLLSSMSADRWNCSATSSHRCIAYQSPASQSSIPTYSCSHCAYRLCFPCIRQQYLKQATSDAARGEVNTVLANQRTLDATVQSWSEVALSEEQLRHRQDNCNYLIGFSAFFAVLLLHAMLGLFSALTDYIENQWTNVILILIFAAIAGIACKALNRLIQQQNVSLWSAMIRLCNYYQELDFQHLLVPQGKQHHTPSQHPDTAGGNGPVHLNYGVHLSYLSPRQRHVVQSVYHQQAEIFRYQSNAPLWSLLSLLFLMASEALIAAAVLIVFVVVLCRLPENVLIGSCETRLGVPIGIGLFCSLLFVHTGELLKIVYAFTTRWMTRL